MQCAVGSPWLENLGGQGLGLGSWPGEVKKQWRYPEGLTVWVIMLLPASLLQDLASKA